MTVDAMIPKLFKLSVDERLDLIEKLEESLPEDIAPSEVPDWHIEILKDRLAVVDANPRVGIPLDEFLKVLRKRP